VVELTHGGGTFEVAHGGGQFRVTTPVGAVTALGTAFSVKFHPGGKTRAGATAKPRMGVAVTEGTVRVDAGGRSFVLSAGKTGTYGEDGEQNNKDDGDQKNNGGQKNDGQQDNGGRGNQPNGENGQQDNGGRKQKGDG
jgi:ferric-dicitrate binding protein FerR (iron transport regulator)